MTPRQLQLLDFLRRFIHARGYAPTYAEIQRHFSLRSSSSAHYLCLALEREGLIRRLPNAKRGIQLVTRKDDASYEIPLLGAVSAGSPIEAILTHETVCVPPGFIGRSNTFALKVRGDSMIDEHISDGDLIVVESQQTALDGQTVIALIDDRDATVKRFFQIAGGIRLQAANPRYKPIIIKPANRVKIQGLVIGVIRPYPH